MNSAAPKLPLDGFFKLVRQQVKPKYVLGTTYTLSLAFFENLIYPEIRSESLRRCLIVSDRLGFDRATIEARALRWAGREYQVVPAPCAASFHPKVWLAIGEDSAAVLAGSGNLTQSGFVSNAEMFDAALFEAGGEHRDAVDDLLRFLKGLRGLWRSFDEHRLLLSETLDRTHEALSELRERMPADSAPSLRFLSNFDGPIVEQLGALLDCKSVLVASPYFGGDVQGVDLIRSTFPEADVRVFPGVHNQDSLDIPLSSLGAMQRVSFHRLKLSSPNRFAHLKLYGFDCGQEQWTFTTSANCTGAALGGKNVEAGLLRRSSADELETYFAIDLDVELPAKQLVASYEDGARWLTLSAEDRGGWIDLVCVDRVTEPVVDATVTIKTGDLQAEATFATLFERSASARLEWSTFGLNPDATKTAVLLTVTGLDRAGRSVRGSALVGDALLLTAEPIHRSAWRAAISMLRADGLPAAADLASLFSLLDGVWSHDFAEAREAPQVRSSSRANRNVSDVAVWPPRIHQGSLGAAGPGGHLRDLEWFQKIVSEFFRPPRLLDEVVSATTADVGDEEAVAETKARRLPAAAATRLWREANKSYASLRDRLSRLEVTSREATKIFPLSTAIFLASLCVRRQLVGRDGDQVAIPEASHLVRNFLLLLFADRKQPPNYASPSSSRYAFTTFPPLAADLQEEFEVTPSPDIAELITTMFAFLHSQRSVGGFPTLAWLTFLDGYPDATRLDDAALERARTVVDQYLADAPSVADWEPIKRSLAELRAVDWRSHEGFSDLTMILDPLSKSASGWPTRLEERRSSFDRRRGRGLRLVYAVDHLSDTCEADDCPQNGMCDPAKRKDLERLLPAICRACGAVLVPKQLWRAYEAKR